MYVYLFFFYKPHVEIKLELELDCGPHGLRFESCYGTNVLLARHLSTFATLHTTC